jgi:hypothetical protein
VETIASAVEQRVTLLERSLRRTRRAAATAGLALAVSVAFAIGWHPAGVSGEIRTRRLVVVDDEGRARVVIGQDPKDTQRRSRSAGLAIHDIDGNERGGFATMDDGSVVFGMDAPAGVGAAMPDRIGLVVYPDGSAHVMLIDNQTRAVAKLQSDGDGGGGVQVFKWDMEAGRIHVRTVTYDGDRRETQPMGE